MRDAFVDVTLEIPVRDVAGMPDPGVYIGEKMRDAADKLCEQSGARLRTDRAPEFHVRRGAHKITREDVFLCASRWAVTVPEAVHIP